MAEEKRVPESFEIEELDDAALEEGTGGSKDSNQQCVPNSDCPNNLNT